MAAAAAAGDVAVVVDPPAGWEDATAKRPHPDVIATIDGPGGGSFVLARMKPGGLATRSARKALLLDVLSGINRRTALGYSPRRELRTIQTKNDLTAHVLDVDLDGKPRMAMAIVEFRGALMLASLTSAVPETLLPSILQSMRTARPEEAATRLERRGPSSDGQLEFSLPEGMWLRPVGAKEKSQGIVAVVQTREGLLTVKKLAETGTDVREESRIVEYMLRTVDGIEAASLSRVRIFKTAAGPEVLHASARLSGPRGAGEVAAGFMPWGYWGYSLWAAGPRAGDLLVQSLGPLSLGPQADKRIVAATPRLGVERERWGLAAASAGVLAVAVGLWLVAGWRRRGAREE